MTTATDPADPRIAPDQRALIYDQAALPVIDLAGLFTGDPADAEAVAAALAAAAETVGFFYIVNHGIPEPLIEGAYAASKAFHSQPRAEKMRCWIGLSTNHRGYVPPEENFYPGTPDRKSYHEAFDLSFEAPADHPDHLAGYRLTGPNVWPDLPGFREQVRAYYDAILALGRRMMTAFELALGVPPGTLGRHVTCPTSQLRLLHYFENDAAADENNVGIGAHSDFECFTILHIGGPGLQVMNTDDRWVEAPPLPSTFIVNIGDCLEAWSGGRFKSTQHRVVNTGRERYSMPLFFATDYHTVIEPLPAYRTPEAVAKYPPIVAGEHLNAMTITGFRYLQELRAKGKDFGIPIPDDNPFRREAKPLDDAAAE